MSYIEVGDENIEVQLRDQRQCFRYGGDCCDGKALLLKDLLEHASNVFFVIND
jgi:hypothetical protein